MDKFVLAVVAAGALFTASAATLAGTISDAGCGKTHADASAKSQACVKKCVAGGKAAVFVSGDNVYTFDAKSADKIKDHLGHKVSIKGKLKGDVLTVKSLKMASAS